MYSVLMYNIKNNKNKDKSPKEKVCPNLTGSVQTMLLCNYNTLSALQAPH